MSRLWREKKQKKLNARLGAAIFSDNVLEVEGLLRKGADPNAFTAPPYAPKPEGYRRPLALAVEFSNAAIIDALLEAGADPLQPLRFAGKDIRLSNAARWGKRPEAIIELIEKAEQEAEAQRQHPNNGFSPNPPFWD
jgi:hypothetical protein